MKFLFWLHYSEKKSPWTLREMLRYFIYEQYCVHWTLSDIFDINLLLPESFLCSIYNPSHPLSLIWIFEENWLELWGRCSTSHCVANESWALCINEHFELSCYNSIIRRWNYRGGFLRSPVGFSCIFIKYWWYHYKDKIK